MVVDEIAETIRRVPFHAVTNNCLIKSFRFKRECGRKGIKARVVISFGFARVDRRIRLAVPIFHAWAEVDGRRIEVARPMDEASLWGTLDSEIKPVMAVWV